MTPLGGMTNFDSNYINFWASFLATFKSHTYCDASICAASPIESYFLQPDAPFSSGDPGSDGTFTIANASPIWPIGNKLFSERFTQLINTFWIDSMAPFAITGKLTFPDPHRTLVFRLTTSSIRPDTTRQNGLYCDVTLPGLLSCSLLL